MTTDKDRQVPAFIFQVFAWHVDDSGPNEALMVTAFGRRDDGQSVGLRIAGFEPSFHLSVDESISSNTDYSAMFALLQKQVGKRLSGNLVGSAGCERAKNLWGFTKHKSSFFRIAFRNQAAYKRLLWRFGCIHDAKLTAAAADDIYRQYQAFRLVNEDQDLKGKAAWEDRVRVRDEFMSKFCGAQNPVVIDWVLDLGDKGLSFEFAAVRLFNKLDPLLQFFHENKLKPAGWISVAPGIAVDSAQKVLLVDIELKVEQRDIHDHERPSLCTAIKQMSFDIETYFSEKTFPSGKNPRDSVFQIGATCKQYGEASVRRFLFHFRTPRAMRLPCNSGLCGSIPDTTVVNCETEQELLLKFRDFVLAEDPDFIKGYNIDSFDCSYLMDRAAVLDSTGKLCAAFATLSRLKGYECVISEDTFSSAGRGDNRYRRLAIPGRLVVDVLGWLQVNVPVSKYDTWGLGVVAQKEIGETKFDIAPEEMKMAWQTGDEQKLTETGSYCCQDTMLPQKIADKMNVMAQLFGMANTTYTPIVYILTRGQQIKVFSLICFTCRNMGYMVPVMDPRGNGTFKGATVVDPKRGVHTDPVITLDLASLYPSIFIAYKICYSTLVRDRELTRRLFDLAKGNKTVEWEGVEYVIVAWTEDVYVHYSKAGRSEYGSIDDAKRATSTLSAVIEAAVQENARGEGSSVDERKGWHMEVKQHSYAFAQVEDCVLPTFLKDILAQRKAVKKMMAAIETSTAVDDKLRYRVLNGQQLALKVTANSVYGFPGAFMLNEIALGSSVTAIGRRINKQTVDFCNDEFENIARTTIWDPIDCHTYLDENLKCVVDPELVEMPPGWVKKHPTASLDRPWAEGAFSVEVIGGDSVTGDTPVLCCRASDGRQFYKTIGELGNGPWKRRSDGKEYRRCDSVLVWSDKGFSAVRHVIRHAAGKPIYRVTTATGIVDATQDHSLLRADGERVAPHDLRIGDELLHTDLPESPINALPTVDRVPYDVAWMLGLFVVYGTCTSQHWMLGGLADHVLRVAMVVLKSAQPTLKCEIVNGVLTCRDNPAFHKTWMALDQNGDALDRIINSAQQTRSAFVNGCYAQTGGRVAGQGIVIRGNKLKAARVYHICASLGHSVAMLGHTPFIIKICKPDAGKWPNEVQGITLMHGYGSRQPVYDLETASGHFHVGPGRMHVHNTDSVFVKFNGSSIAHAISLGYKAADLLTARFDRRPICMEYEKVHCPLIVHMKKNYAGLKHTVNDKDFVFSSTGLPLAKRSSCQFLKRVYMDVLLTMLSCAKSDDSGKVVMVQSNDPVASALARLEHHLNELREGRVPVEELFLSKALKSSYRGGVACQPCLDKPDPECKACSGQGNIVTLPHVSLANRMRLREPGSEPGIGQRFSYLIVRDEYRDDSISENSETPEFAQRNGLQPDALFYLCNQLRIPLVNLFDLAGHQIDANALFNTTEDLLIEHIKQIRKTCARQTQRPFGRAAPKPSAMYVKSKKELATMRDTAIKITDYLPLEDGAVKRPFTTNKPPPAPKRPRKNESHTKITAFFAPSSS